MLSEIPCQKRPFPITAKKPLLMLSEKAFSDQIFFYKIFRQAHRNFIKKFMNFRQDALVENENMLSKMVLHTASQANSIREHTTNCPRSTITKHTTKHSPAAHSNNTHSSSIGAGLHTPQQHSSSIAAGPASRKH